MHSKIICLDAQISAWVFRDESPVNESDRVFFTKANNLITKLIEKDYKLLFPQIVLAENASFLSEQEQIYFFNTLPDGLLNCDFTERTTRILAKILHIRYVGENKAYQEKGITKTQMKYDALILACAIDSDAECFYTVDADFKRNSTQFIPIKNLDELPNSYNEAATS